MGITVTTEKRFEDDITSFWFSPAGGYTVNHDQYDPQLGLFPATLLRFVQKTQPKEWARFENANKVEPERKFCQAFNMACDTDGLVSVLRHGFKHRGISFRVSYFKPESGLNKTAAAQYAANEITCNRQWFYSVDTHNSVDVVLAVNGIPVFAFELKNQYTGQTVDNAKKQWMYDRDPREVCFQFNKRILGYFCVDHTEVWMATKLAGKNTYFLPFNQGSNGAGRDGGKGNPPNPDGYPTAYLWETVFPKDSMMDILQKFLHLQTTEDKKLQADGSVKITKKQTLIFPRYHQLDVVRKLLADVAENGAGHNYLIQHSAGSGKSNSIAWTAYRLASLHNEADKPVYSSVIVVTDRTVLDAQLQNTISGFDHTLGAIEAIGEDKSSKDLRNAINDGVRIIVTTLQKFPVIYTEVNKVAGRNYAVIVDEAHSSQTGSAALKLNNRRKFDAYIWQEMHDLKSDETLFLVVIDIDRFKTINDSYGHVEGDNALVALAELLKKACASGKDFAARYGGDEFALVCIRPKAAPSLPVMDVLCHALAQYNGQSGKPYTLTISYGVAAYRSDAPMTEDALKQQADEAMYQMKAGHHAAVPSLCAEQ